MPAELTPPHNRQRAVFLLCRPDESPLIPAVAAFFLEGRWAAWRGDVHRFAPHITLRGVFSPHESRVPLWIAALREVASCHAPISLGSSRVVARFPEGFALGFDTDPDSKNRLQRLATDVAEATRPFIRWLPLMPSELAEARESLSASLNEKSLHHRLDEVERLVTEGAVPPLPTARPYRLPLLLRLWGDAPRINALYRWGDPFVHEYEPHVSLLALGGRAEQPNLSEEIIGQHHPQLLGQAPQVCELHVMAETPTGTTPVTERSPFNGTLHEARRSLWEIEDSIVLAEPPLQNDRSLTTP